jgi:2',3'-cyclic-nucleotide 2'-phosphodiesterase (5'-nucleotidase family)
MQSTRGWIYLFTALALAACAPSPSSPAVASPSPLGSGAGGAALAAPAAPRGPVTLTILGTNDLHGALDRLPILAGYVANVRAVRAADSGATLLLDAGDMFQGTLESNLNEGAAVIAAYGAIGYTAAAIGNHEFDFGPIGPAATPGPGDDPRAALKARAAEAAAQGFPLLAGNLNDAMTGARVDWPNMPASLLVDAAGVKVGIVGVATEDVPTTTMAANVVGLAMAKPAVTILAEAQRLRAAGARVVVVTGHLGTKCKDLGNPEDASSCDPGEELNQVLAALPPGTIDVFVAGHTHQPVAHRIAGVAVIESYSNGRAFGRVDLQVPAVGAVTSVIHPPQMLCPTPAAGGNPRDSGPAAPASACAPPPYEGRPVVPSAQVAALIAPHVAAAAVRRDERLGVDIAEPIWRRYDQESPVGNLVADLMLAARPDADVALTNGGGLRADLPVGPLTYGALYQAQPFDNLFAIVRITGKQLESLVTQNLGVTSGIASWGGMTVRARCRGDRLVVELRDRRGARIPPGKTLTMVTSDFLASGGEGAFVRAGIPKSAITITDTVIRDGIAAVLRRRGGRLAPAPYFDAKKPRFAYPAPRPVTCARPSP